MKRLYMKRLVLFLAAASTVFSQTSASISLTSSSPSVRPGQQVTLTESFVDSSPTSSVAAIQWTLVLPAQLSSASLASTIGSAATSASKTLVCGVVICEISGLNVNLLANGTLATTALTVPTGTAAGVYPLSLAGIIGATALGYSANPTATSGTVNLTVLSRYDVNGDGVVNSTDVTTWITAVIVGASCTPLLDVNGDGVCNVLDLQSIVAASLGKIPL